MLSAAAALFLSAPAHSSPGLPAEASSTASSSAGDPLPQQAPPRPSHPSRAEDETNSPTLDTVVISADRGVPLAYPGGRDVIEPETKEKYADQNVATVLRRTPGVYFIPENGNDSRISVGLRGNDPRRSGLSALLLDGIPISEAPYGNTDVDGLPIAFDRVWRTDVIRGGASIRYGPNSAGGIVNFLTEPVPRENLLRLGSRVGSDGEYGESIALGGTWDRFGALFTGVVKGGDGYRENGDFQDWDGAFKARYALSDSESLQAYVSRFTELDAKQPGGLSQAAYDADPHQTTRPGGSFDFDFDRYVLQYEKRIDPDSTFELKVWYQEGRRVLNDFRPILPPFTVTRQQNSDFDSGAIEASYTWKTELFGLPNAFFHSARMLRETNDELYVRTPIAGGPPLTPLELNALFQGRAFSTFNEDVISLTRDVDVGLGFRAESITMFGRSHDDGNEIVQDYQELLPEANVTWKLGARTALYGSYQQSFFPPQYETGFDPASVLYAPTKPEHSEAFEVGLRWREIDGLESSVALFDTEFHDKIDFINTSSGLKIPVNTGHARAAGVEIGASYDVGAASRALDGLSVYGTLTAQRSKIEVGENDGKNTPNSPHYLASWGAQYDHHPTGLWGRVGGSYSAKAFKDPANTETGSADGVNGPEPSFVLWDAAVGWSQRPDHTGFSLTLGVTNLFDEEYFRRFSTGIFPGAPRQEFAAVSYEVRF